MMGAIHELRPCLGGAQNGPATYIQHFRTKGEGGSKPTENIRLYFIGDPKAAFKQIQQLPLDITLTTTLAKKLPITSRKYTGN